MSTIVEDLVTNGKALIATTLGATYSQLDYEHKLEQNNFLNKTKRYGFVAGEAETLEDNTTRGRQAVSHQFTIILTTDFVNFDSDSPQTTALNALFEQAHTLIGAFRLSKVNTPGVLVVNFVNIEPPEALDEDKVTAIRVNLNINYRYTL